jgi:hypothetical protein
MLSRDSHVSELASELAPLHPRNDTVPGEVFLHLAADALDGCGASRTEPLALERDGGSVPARVFFPRSAESQASVRDPGSRGAARRNRA